jgi:hypothetical protein
VAHGISKKLSRSVSSTSGPDFATRAMTVADLKAEAEAEAEVADDDWEELERQWSETEVDALGYLSLPQIDPDNDFPSDGEPDQVRWRHETCATLNIPQSYLSFVA